MRTRRLLLLGLALVALALLLPWMKAAYDQWLSFLSIEAIGGWPAPIRLVLAVLFTDFLNWFHHWVRHVVPALWEFHAVHHSQREMSYLTDMRFHALDLVFAQLIMAVPMFMVGIAEPTVLVWAVVKKWHTCMYHSNLRVRYGWWRYILVTPQSHRIHHSLRPEHRDTNFGVLFSFWDRLFGTQHPDSESFPATGVGDPSFPLEQDCRPLSLVRTFGAQFAHPFRRALRTLHPGKRPLRRSFRQSGR